MTNKTKTILCVCALTASAFAWNATADGENSGVYYNNTTYGGAWHIQHHPTDPEGTTGNEDRTTLFSALSKDSVLSFSIERNDTENGFRFGTYTTTTGIDEHGNEITIIHKETLGTVTQKGEVGNGVEKIEINDAKTKVDVGSVDSSTFSANDLVGVWVQEINSIDASGNMTYKDPIYYSNNTLTQNNNTSLPVDSDGNPMRDSRGELLHFNEGYEYRIPDPTDPTGQATIETGKAALWFDDATKYYPANQFDPIGTPARYEYSWPGQDNDNSNPPAPEAAIKILVQGRVVTPAGGASGGPLPGVWATIALAGAASAYLKRRRKENK